MTRPGLILASLIVAAMLAGQAMAIATAMAGERPNVLLIVTDDQGYGDLGFHGNTQIKTPRLDRLARESTRFRSFYVSPVCSPTRASLMTSRYNYRTGVVDTFRGRSILRAEEVTLAEMLAAAGYRTGIFGKWHLGDNAPFRPIDQGFQEALVHRGGGIGQGSAPPGGDSYFDPVLVKNGVETATKGYCSDIFADGVIRFIESDRSRPFFAYLAFNAPHYPLEVPAADLRAYEGLKADPTPGAPPTEVTARVYAMVSNLDANIGRVLDRLDALNLTRETIVVFLTDNGPDQIRYNAGMTGLKGTVREGGIRVPCFVRWPGVVQPGREVEAVAAHIDLAPTLLAACGVARPVNVALDGVDLLPLLKGEASSIPERTIYLQWHRGDTPELGRGFAARSSRYKLLQAAGVERLLSPVDARFELYDMQADPLERVDLAATQPEVVARLRQGYDAWFADVNQPRPPSRIDLGSTRENPSRLTRQDWRGNQTRWEGENLGGWDVEVVREGVYDLTFLYAAGSAGTVTFDLAGQSAKVAVEPGSRSCRFEGVKLAPGPGRLRAWVERPEAAVGVFQAVVERR